MAVQQIIFERVFPRSFIAHVHRNLFAKPLLRLKLGNHICVPPCLLSAAFWHVDEAVVFANAVTHATVLLFFQEWTNGGIRRMRKDGVENLAIHVDPASYCG